MLTDLNEILKSFDEVALAQLYLDHFEVGFRERAFDAIPGKETTVSLGKHKVTTTSYAVLDDEHFRKWHDQTLQHVQSFAPDETQVASSAAYANLTVEQFRLLAERSRNARGIPPAEGKGKPKAKRTKAGDAQTTQGSTRPEKTENGADATKELVAS